jgi:hypothetical protein
VSEPEAPIFFELVHQRIVAFGHHRHGIEHRDGLTQREIVRDVAVVGKRERETGRGESQQAHRDGVGTTRNIRQAIAALRVGAGAEAKRHNHHLRVLERALQRI